MRNRAGWAMGLALVWIACRVVSGFDGPYGQDAHEYLRYATALRNWLTTGADPSFSRLPASLATAKAPR